MSKKILAITSALAIAGTLAASPAEACFDYESLSPTESGELIAAAEKALNAGDARGALDLLEYSPAMDSWRHGNKRMEIVAIANIRSGRAERGVLSLRYLLRKQKDDPFLLARLAEGLALTKNGRAEALAILDRLDRDDLMPDANAQTVLASLLPSERTLASKR
jgi:hypothetical protein